MGKAKRERGREKREQRSATIEHQVVQQRRTRRLWLTLGAPIAVAVIAAVVLIAVSQRGSTKHVSSTTALAAIHGIPVSGLVLGRASAPVTIQEFADLQCPICRRFTQTVLPTLVQRLVRTGKAKIQYEPFVVLGDDSYTAGEDLLAAADQNRGWAFIEAFYADQRTENSGYVTTSFVHGIDHTAGVDASAQDAALNGSALSGYDRAIHATQAAAHADGFQGTPSLRVTGPGGAKNITDPFNAGSIESAVQSVSSR